MDRRVVGAGEIAAARSLDLDHPRPEVAEVARAERPCQACSRARTVIPARGNGERCHAATPSRVDEECDSRAARMLESWQNRAHPCSGCICGRC